MPCSSIFELYISKHVFYSILLLKVNVQQSRYRFLELECLLADYHCNVGLIDYILIEVV